MINRQTLIKHIKFWFAESMPPRPEHADRMYELFYNEIKAGNEIVIISIPSNSADLIEKIETLIQKGQ